jgi:hypothetical protein
MNTFSSEKVNGPKKNKSNMAFGPLIIVNGPLIKFWFENRTLDFYFTT